MEGGDIQQGRIVTEQGKHLLQLVSHADELRRWPVREESGAECEAQHERQLPRNSFPTEDRPVPHQPGASTGHDPLQAAEGMCPPPLGT